MATLSETANKVLKANSDDIKTIVANLEPAIDQLQQTGPALTQSLNILLTFPFYEPTIPTIIKGDYVNSDLVLDLTPSRLNKSMFATARFIGPEGVVGKPASGAKRGLNLVHRAAGQRCGPRLPQFDGQVRCAQEHRTAGRPEARRAHPEVGHPQADTAQDRHDHAAGR